MTTTNVVHAALWLVVVLGGVAAQYILAAAEFVAVSQVMVYIGAVMVLFLFGIMLTRASIGDDDESTTRAGRSASRSPCCSSRCWPTRDRRLRRHRAGDPPNAQIAAATRSPTATSATTSSRSIALSFVLLAALIGAIVVARKD